MISKILENGNLEVTIPVSLRARSGRRRIIMPDTVSDGTEPLALALARAFRWQQYIDDGKFKNITELAKNVGLDEATVARTIRLRLLSPTIVHRIIKGEIPQRLNMTALRAPLSDIWKEQEQKLLGEE